MKDLSSGHDQFRLSGGVSSPKIDSNADLTTYTRNYTSIARYEYPIIRTERKVTKEDIHDLIMQGSLYDV